MLRNLGIYENKDKAYDYINLLYHVEAAHYNYTYIDAEHMTVDEICDSIRDYVNTVLYKTGVWANLVMT